MALRVSDVRETDAFGVESPQPAYLNAVVIGKTALAPHALLEFLLGVEDGRGRTRPFPLAPRTLDLDLILFGGLVVDQPGLRIPHPRFRERRFVLEPLAELAPEWIDPVTGTSVQELLDALVHDS